MTDLCLCGRDHPCELHDMEAIRRQLRAALVLTIGIGRDEEREGSVDG